MTTSPHSLPLPLRLMNLAGEGARRIGLQPIKLDVDGLLEKAMASSGLTDFGGDEFRQPLALLVESLEKEANLSTMGRIVARTDLLRTLDNRLRMVDLFRQHPEISEQPVSRPIFVIGAPPGPGRICLIRSVVVRTLLTGGAENPA